MAAPPQGQVLGRAQAAEEVATLEDLISGLDAHIRQPVADFLESQGLLLPVDVAELRPEDVTQVLLLAPDTFTLRQRAGVRKVHEAAQRMLGHGHYAREGAAASPKEAEEVEEEEAGEDTEEAGLLSGRADGPGDAEDAPTCLSCSSCRRAPLWRMAAGMAGGLAMVPLVALAMPARPPARPPAGPPAGPPAALARDGWPPAAERPAERPAERAAERSAERPAERPVGAGASSPPPAAPAAADAAAPAAASAAAPAAAPPPGAAPSAADQAPPPPPVALRPAADPSDGGRESLPEVKSAWLRPPKVGSLGGGASWLPTKDDGLPHGSSLGLVPFLPQRETDPPPVPKEWTREHLEWTKFVAKPYEGRPNVIWVHLHNFAGTYMCQSARAQGEMVTKKNCNWPGDGVVGQGWGKPYAHLARCPERAASHQISFSMIERGLGHGDLGCEGVVTGIMFRDPFKGARSTVLYNRFQRDRKELLELIRDGVREVPKPLKRSHNGLPGTDTYQHFDNFAVRTLSGHYYDPPGSMTREHLEMAKAVLARIDVVLVLEELKDHFVQLSQVFHWEMRHQASNRKVNGHRAEQYDTAFTEEDTRLFYSLNHLDYELYNYSRSLAAARTRAAAGRAARAELAGAGRRLGAAPGRGRRRAAAGPRAVPRLWQRLTDAPRARAGENS